MLASEDHIKQFLEDYPSLRKVDSYACLDYAASLGEEQISLIDKLENVV